MHKDFQKTLYSKEKSATEKLDALLTDYTNLKKENQNSIEAANIERGFKMSLATVLHKNPEETLGWLCEKEEKLGEEVVSVMFQAAIRANTKFGKPEKTALEFAQEKGVKIDGKEAAEWSKKKNYKSHSKVKQPAIKKLHRAHVRSQNEALTRADKMKKAMEKSGSSSLVSVGATPGGNPKKSNRKGSGPTATIS